MKLLGWIVAGVFFVTFIWGVLVHVMEGGWSLKHYTFYYCKEVQSNFVFVGEIIHKKVERIKIQRPTSEANSITG